jgi:hypothetical protein
MELNENQLADVAKWFAAGASLDEIQKRISSEFGVHMTYLDLRLLVADLPQPEEEDADAQAGGGVETRRSGADGSAGGDDVGAADVPSANDGETTEAPQDGDNADGAAGPPPAEGPGGVSVTVDPITPPGVMAGGGVTFSDGTAGKWYLDQMGRLGLGGVPKGYRPSPEDAALFQSRLVEALQAKGLM